MQFWTNIRFCKCIIFDMLRNFVRCCHFCLVFMGYISMFNVLADIMYGFDSFACTFFVSFALLFVAGLPISSETLFPIEIMIDTCVKLVHALIVFECNGFSSSSVGETFPHFIHFEVHENYELEFKLELNLSVFL